MSTKEKLLLALLLAAALLLGLLLLAAMGVDIGSIRITKGIHIG